VPTAAAARADQHEVGVVRRLALSLAAAALGWCAAVAVCLLSSGREFSNWPTAIGALSFAVGLQVASASPVDSPLLRRGWAALFGSVCGVILLVLMLAGSLGWPLQKEATLFFVAAALCGAVTWESYGFLLRRQSRTSLNARLSDSSP
jgi:peptidoglycan/LPS O-acetylase OafA/YrhL